MVGSDPSRLIEVLDNDVAIAKRTWFRDLDENSSPSRNENGVIYYNLALSGVEITSNPLGWLSLGTDSVSVAKPGIYSQESRFEVETSGVWGHNPQSSTATSAPSAGCSTGTSGVSLGEEFEEFSPGRYYVHVADGTVEGDGKSLTSTILEPTATLLGSGGSATLSAKTYLHHGTVKITEYLTIKRIH